MKYFLAINGRVYADRPENRWIPRLALENNLFDSKEEAWSASFLLEEYQPMIFYGKPANKKGLLLYARGDTEATYRKRT
jgi:hypothetical protein